MNLQRKCFKKKESWVHLGNATVPIHTGNAGTCIKSFVRTEYGTTEQHNENFEKVDFSIYTNCRMVSWKEFLNTSTRRDLFLVLETIAMIERHAAAHSAEFWI
jgi:hypothetical protein